MSVLSPPEPRQDELELLIREARERQRRRRVIAALVLASAAAVVLVVQAGLPGGPKAGRGAQGRVSAPFSSLPRCPSGDLRVAGAFGGAGTGSVRDVFTFTNSSATRCTLHGWPSLRVILRRSRSAAARPIRRSAEGAPLAHPTVVLEPGGAASFVVLSSDGIGLSSPCPGGRDVLVTPPGGHLPLRVAYPLTYCGPGSVRVAPLVAGRVVRQYF